MKIGVSSDVEKRRRTLRRGLPFDIEIIFAGPGSHAMERTLHRQFADSRLGGEWFRPNPEIPEAVRAASAALGEATASPSADAPPFSKEWFVAHAPRLIEVVAWPRPAHDRVGSLIAAAAERSGIPERRIRSYWYRKFPNPAAHEIGALAVLAKRACDASPDALVIPGEMRIVAEHFEGTIRRIAAAVLPA